jgi:Sel1 repeat
MIRNVVPINILAAIFLVMQSGVAAAQGIQGADRYFPINPKLQAAADSGNWGSQFVLCLHMETGPHPDRRKSDANDYKRAAECWKKYAEEGNPHAEARLGYLLTVGQGVEQNYQEAKMWFLRAVEKNQPLAQKKLGELYEEGLGVSQSFNEAIKWYRKAAQQGDNHAQNKLAAIYFEGRGVQRDLEEAAFWYGAMLQDYSKQAKSSNGPPARISEAITRYDTATKSLTPAQIEAVTKRVDEWKPLPLGTLEKCKSSSHC